LKCCNKLCENIVLKIQQLEKEVEAKKALLDGQRREYPEATKLVKESSTVEKVEQAERLLADLEQVLLAAREASQKQKMQVLW
jgi:hypothetical protein